MPDEPTNPIGNIEQIDIDQEMKDSFLEYAMSVIVSRALPDVRDGLKPVHRRILYSMYDSGIRPGTPYRKCARVVGDVMGWFHPHSNDAIYDALVRLGQDFSTRHPLVDPQGNFGTVDDPPAAMRYCVTGDTLVRTQDGTVPISEVADALPNSETGVDVKMLGRRHEPVLATKFFHSGIQPTKRLVTTEGFELTGTGNHPVLCLAELAGVPMLVWRLLEEIEPGDRVVIARNPQEPGPGSADRAQIDEAFLAGAWVSEGFASVDRAGFNNTDGEWFDAVVDAFDRVVGGPRYVYHRALPSGATIHELDIQNMTAVEDSKLQSLIGLRSAEKRVPEWVWAADAGVKRAFLQALFEGDGSCSALGRNTVQVSYSTRSPRLAREVQLLLTEFGVITRNSHCDNGEIKVVITNKRDASLFADRVGFWGSKQEKLGTILDRIPVDTSSMSSDSIPFLAAYIRSEAGRGGLEWLKKHNIDRIERWERYGDEIIGKIANHEVRNVVTPLVDAGYYYATVQSVDEAGLRPVYSVRVDSSDHAFLGNGFVNHNTECRLAPLAMNLLEGIDEDTVDFEDNYSGERQEPSVLPARFPNLLVNGSTGIAVGMATNIPPHNLGEVIDAVLHAIKHPDATAEDLTQFIKGPDFPTGAYIIGTRGLKDALLTGRGSVRMRAVTDVVEIKKNKTAIIVTEIPYQVSRDRIMSKIADLVRDKSIEGISDLRDESDRNGTRLVIELKRDANPQVVLNQLFKGTQLEDTFGVNAVALVDKVPRMLNIADFVHHYIEHQLGVIERRTRYRLKKAQDRAHIVEGLLIALDNIDEVVAIIRGSENTEIARAALRERFELSEIQAGHILDMPLRRLTALETGKLREEYESLQATIKALNSILGSEEQRREIIAEELTAIKEKFANPRRSRIIPDDGDFSLEDLIADDELVVSLTVNGYVKAVPANSYKRQGRGGRGVKGGTLRDDDVISQALHTTAHAYLLFFTNRGKVYRMKAHQLPRKERTAKGSLVHSVLPVEPDERIEAVIDTRDYETSRYLVMFTRKGQVKKTKFSEYDSRNAILIAISLDDDDEVVAVRTTMGDNDLMMFTKMGQGIRFAEDDVRAMGRDTRGVRGVRLREGDSVVSASTASEGEEVLLVTTGGYGKRTKMAEFPKQKRGGMGVKAIKLTRVRGELVAGLAISPGDHIFFTSSDGIVIRTDVDEVSRQGRAATGVRVMNLEGDARVAAVALVPREDEDEEQVDLELEGE